jgi:hypothetical protein
MVRDHYDPFKALCNALAETGVSPFRADEPFAHSHPKLPDAAMTHTCQNWQVKKMDRRLDSNGVSKIL